MNKIFLIGNLGEEPTLRKSRSGSPVCNFTLAVDHVYYSGDERKRMKEVDWFQIVVWNNLGEVCYERLAKGGLVAIEGRVRPRTWTDRDGVPHKSVDIVATTVKFLSKTKELTTAEHVEIEEEIPVLAAA